MPDCTVSCWARRQAKFAKSHLLEQQVAFIIDPSQGMYDRFGRTYRESEDNDDI